MTKNFPFISNASAVKQSYYSGLVHKSKIFLLNRKRKCKNIIRKCILNLFAARLDSNSHNVQPFRVVKFKWKVKANKCSDKSMGV